MNQVSRNEAKVQVSQPDQIHTFSLLPVESAANTQKQVEIVFKPQINSQGQLNYTIPIFNNDKNPLTPAFILGIDQKNLNFDTKDSNRENLTILQQTYNQKPILIEPEPRHNYCHICKETYTSYIKHIQNEIHKKKLKKSPFDEHIYKLIDNFKLSKLNEQKIQKKTTSIVVNDCAFRQPRKRRIIQNSLTLAPKSILLGKDGAQSTNCSFSLMKQKAQSQVKQQ